MSLLREIKTKDFANRTPFVTAFGELVVGSRKNNITVPFNYNNGHIGTVEYMKITKIIQSGTGVDTHENETAYCETGVNVSNSELISKSTNRYITGHGNEVFHTMVWDGSETGVNSGIGYGQKDDDFIGFGYQNTIFGIWVTLRGVRTFIPQSSWNIDTLISGNFVFDPQKENIGGTSFGWLGVADILFYINTSKDDWVLVHRHQTANINTKPHLSNPSQPISTWIERPSGSGANIRVGTSSWYGGTVGEKASGTGNDKTPLVERTGVTVGAETVLLSIRNKTTFAGKPNTIRLRYGTLTITSDGNKSVDFKVYLDGVTGGTWGDFDTDLSVSEVSIDTTLATTTRTIVTGLDAIDEQVGSTALAKVDRDRINLFSNDIVIAAYPGETITITAQSASTNTIDFQLRWIEEF